MENKELFLEYCSDLRLLKELEKRIRKNEISIYNSADKGGERFMVCMKGEKDKDAFFLYLAKKQMSTLITDFKTQMDKIHGGNYGE